MVTIVVVLNFLIALLCLGMAWQMGKVRRLLANATKALIVAERNTYNVLSPAPNAILKGQAGISWLTAQYQQSPYLLQPVQRVFVWLVIGQKIWLRGSKWQRSKLGLRRK
jgi:hypothetical protein